MPLKTFAEKHPRGFCALLFALALAPRLFYLTELPRNPLFDNILEAFDHYNFDQGALNLLKGDWLARAPNNTYAPLYKYFLGLLYLVFGRNFYLVYGAQFVMGAAGSVLIHAATRRLFGFLPGLCAWALFAFYTSEIVHEGSLHRDPFIAFWGILAFYLLVRLQDSLRRNHLILSALALSFFIQGRPNNILFLPGICLFLAIHILPRMPADQRRHAWPLFFGTLLLTFIPLLAQCYLVYGRFIFFDASGPHTFISGNLRGYSGVGFDVALVDEHLKRNVLGYGANIRFLIGHILEDPFAFFLLYLRKIYFFYNDFEAPSNTSDYLYREFSPALDYLISHFALISGLGLAGLVLICKHRQHVMLTLGFHFTSALSVFLFLNEARYRIPTVPFLAIPGGYAAAWIIRSLASGGWRKAAIASATAASLVFCFQEVSGLHGIREEDLNNMAAAFARRNELKTTEHYLNRALAAYPNGPLTRFNKGGFHLMQKEWELSAHYLESAADRGAPYEQLPQLLHEALFNLAQERITAGDCVEGKKALLRLLRREPDFPDAWANLALCHQALGEFREARDTAMKALALKPDFAAVRELLAQLPSP